MLDDTSALTDCNNTEKSTIGKPIAELTPSPEPKFKEDNSDQNRHPKSSKNIECPMTPFQITVLKQEEEEEKAKRKTQEKTDNQNILLNF
jgi:hypothetical protein